MRVRTNDIFNEWRDTQYCLICLTTYDLRKKVIDAIELDGMPKSLPGFLTTILKAL